jgi:hypothetical protein
LFQQGTGLAQSACGLQRKGRPMVMSGHFPDVGKSLAGPSCPGEFLIAGQGEGAAQPSATRIDGILEAMALRLAGEAIHHRPDGIRLVSLLPEFEFHRWFGTLFVIRPAIVWIVIPV